MRCQLAGQTDPKSQIVSALFFFLSSLLISLSFWREGDLELNGTRHLVLAWVPIILAAMIIGRIVAIALNTILSQLGLDLLYIAELIGSLAGALALAFVLKKHHIPVKGLPD